MKRSVALETTWFVVLTVALVVLVELFNLRFLTSHNQEMAKKQAQVDLDTYTLALQRQIGFYQRLLEGLATRTDVRNLLDFVDGNEAFQWALNYRKLLPDTVGLSLISREGEILGNPASLFIGALCRADIAELNQDGKIAVPAVHQERTGLEHFDLFTPVNNVNGERLGYLFASFRLTVVQDLLNAMTHDGHKLTVVAADQAPIASVDRFLEAPDDAFKLSRSIAGTTWHATLVSKPTGIEQTVTILLITTSVLVLFIGLSVALFSRHLSKGLLQEISSIRTALDQIAEGIDTPVDIRPRFRETAPLMDAVMDVSNRIQTQQETLKQLSETDSLTGLLNRRRFTQELENAWALANRQVNVFVMTLDIDGFKQINDQHGHAVGDLVLRTFADCLDSCTRSTDVVARLGGDEFVVLLIHSDEATGLELFKRLGTCFERGQTDLPIDARLYSTLSAGLVNIDPGVDTNAEVALRRADEALYRAKQTGKNQIQY